MEMPHFSFHFMSILLIKTIEIQSHAYTFHMPIFAWARFPIRQHCITHMHATAACTCEQSLPLSRPGRPNCRRRPQVLVTIRSGTGSPLGHVEFSRTSELICESAQCARALDRILDATKGSGDHDL